MTAETPKPPTDEETRESYRKLAAMIINGDAEKKAKLDECVTKLLTRMRLAFPTLSDKTLTAFAASTGYLMGQAMTVQARDLSEFMEHTFHDYMMTAAVLSGGYDLEDSTLPPVPVPEVVVAPEPVAESYTYDSSSVGPYL